MSILAKMSENIIVSTINKQFIEHSTTNLRLSRPITLFYILCSVSD